MIDFLRDTYLINYVVLTVPFGVLLLKGKGWFTLVCLLLGFLPLGPVMAIVGSLRLAKPNSWWARRRYDVTTMEQAAQRYPDAPGEPEVVLAAVGWILLVVVGPVFTIVGLLVTVPS